MALSVIKNLFGFSRRLLIEMFSCLAASLLHFPKPFLVNMKHLFLFVVELN